MAVKRKTVNLAVNGNALIATEAAGGQETTDVGVQGENGAVWLHCAIPADWQDLNCRLDVTALNGALDESGPPVNNEIDMPLRQGVLVPGNLVVSLKGSDAQSNIRKTADCRTLVVQPSTTGQTDVSAEYPQAFEELQAAFDTLNNGIAADVQTCEQKADASTASAAVSATSALDAKASENNAKTSENQMSQVLTTLSAPGISSPSGVYATAAALQSAYPSGDTHIYLVTADGNWYYWNTTTSAWTAGGVYQSTGISDNSVTKEMLESDVQALLPQDIYAPEYTDAVTDSSGRVALGIRQDGSVDAPGGLHTAAIGDVGLAESDPAETGIVDGLVDAEGRQAENVIGRDGRVPQWILDAWTERMTFPPALNYFFNGVEYPVAPGPDITCIGDSLTAGAGGNGTSYPLVLSVLARRVAHNLGVGGENCYTIVARAGGTRMLVNNITIPAGTAAVQVATYAAPLSDSNGHPVYPLRQGDGGVNPCSIAGVTGTLSIAQSGYASTDAVWYFTRSVAGDAVAVNRPTPILTPQNDARRGDILVIFIGQNGGYTDEDDLVAQINSLIKSGITLRREYIVLGKNTGTPSSQAAEETRLGQEYGRRYICLRDYLSKYGLADAGITPTAQDNTDTAAGLTPTSLRYDSVHLNAAGYTVVGNLIYNRMKELEMI